MNASMRARRQPGQALLLALLAIAAFFAWKHFQSPPPIDAFASGNGRIEATEIDVASKTGGRLASASRPASVLEKTVFLSMGSFGCRHCRRSRTGQPIRVDLSALWF